MKRINERTVHLDDDEMEASAKFEDLLDQGYGIAAAVAEVRKSYPTLSDDFWQWLS